ncbi:unnamed protein product, partial [Staurois parvus]
VSPAAIPAISSGRCRHLASVFRPCDPVTSGCTGAGTGGKFEIFKKNVFFFLIAVSMHFTYIFRPYCFVLCPACILTVLSAWKLRKVHGVQKASLYIKSGFRLAREQR